VCASLLRASARWFKSVTFLARVLSDGMSRPVVCATGLALFWDNATG